MDPAKFQEMARPFLYELQKQMDHNHVKFLDHWFVDHICYRSDSEKNYSELKATFNSMGSLLCETMVGGRLISVFKLTEPIFYNNRPIDVLELPAPKLLSPRKQGFEHIEVVIDEKFQKIKERYPKCKFDEKGLSKELNPELCLKLDGLSIKFHHMPLEEVIKIEQAQQIKAD